MGRRSRGEPSTRVGVPGIECPSRHIHLVPFGITLPYLGSWVQVSAWVSALFTIIPLCAVIALILTMHGQAARGMSTTAYPGTSRCKCTRLVPRRLSRVQSAGCRMQIQAGIAAGTRGWRLLRMVVPPDGLFSSHPVSIMSNIRVCSDAASRTERTGLLGRHVTVKVQGTCRYRGGSRVGISTSGQSVERGASWKIQQINTVDTCILHVIKYSEYSLNWMILSSLRTKSDDNG